MYVLLGICLSLIGLLAINSFASMLTALLWRGVSQAAKSWSTSTRAQLAFFLRIAPALAAILCVGGLFLPAYLANEPRHTTETVTAKIGLLAAISLYGIGLSLWRRFAAYLATRRLVKDWLKYAEPVRIENVAIPAFRFRHRFPVIAIVGVIRPKLFIAGQIFDSLSPEEVSAAMAHENGHLASGDNFKRGLVRACRDVLSVIPLGRTLDREWLEAAELAADEHAAEKGASIALNLASALVKVARLVPRGASHAMIAGAFLITEGQVSIRSRVLRLTQLAAESNGLRTKRSRTSNLAVSVCLSCLLAAAILTLCSSGFLVTVHSTLEYFVSALQ